MVGHFTDSDAVLEFLAGEKLFALAELGTSCPDHFLRTKVKPLVLDLPATAPVDECVARLAELHEQYRADYRAYYERHATPDSPPMRGADPAIVLVPGVGHVLVRQGQADRPRRGRVLRQRDQRDARCRVGVDATRRSPSGEVPHRVLGARGGQAAAPARSRSATPVASRSSPARRAASAAPIAAQLAAEGACVVIADLDVDKAQAAAAELGGADVAVGVARRRHRRRRGAGRDRRHAARVRRHRPRRQQRRAVDLQAAARDDRARLGPPARRDGEGQLPRRAGRGAGDDRPAARRRHRLHRVEERGVRRPEQRRVQRDEGRPGAPGAAARRGARRARHPGERREPRRRGARQRHLRRRLGRAARRGLRRARGGARRVLRATHAPEARGAARARRPRRRGDHVRRARPHHRAARPRRRGRRRPRSCAERST